MRGGKQLLLLAVFVVLARCQTTPQVSMSPAVTQIFAGDLFYLNCDSASGSSTVKWYLNNEVQTVTTKTWKIAPASPKHTGDCQCEINGQRSNTFSIKVLGYLPRASLTIQTGQPVMRPGGSVVLQLDNDDGLQGWRCWVYRGEKTKRITLRLENNESHIFQPNSLNVTETIFWCSNKENTSRSNQITVRTSEKDVSLEMYPFPAVEGESLTLRCLVWGTDQITRTVFFKDDIEIKTDPSPTYKISKVTESEKGKYKCEAIFTHTARTRGPSYDVVSDNQDVFVQAAPMRAVLSGNVPMSCSCPSCPGGVSYRWYRKNDDNGQPSALKDRNHGSMMPEDSGIYTCRAVWSNGMSSLSNSHSYESPIKTILVIVVIMLVILGFLIAAAAYYCRYKKRRATGPIYEDVALALRDKGDDKYEELHKSRGAQAEGEYHALHPEQQGGEKAEGQYEPLKNEGTKAEVYHTLGVEGSAGGAGGYEALKKEGMKEGVYHTLGTEEAAGGAGGYEALKKEGMKPEVYHTLGMEGAAEGAGGYEALKKEGMKEGVYHTLGTEEAAGGN